MSVSPDILSSYRRGLPPLIDGTLVYVDKPRLTAESSVEETANTPNIEREILRAQLAVERLKLGNEEEELGQELEELKSVKANHKAELVGQISDWLIENDEDIYRTKTGKRRHKVSVIQKVAQRKAKRLITFASRKNGALQIGLDGPILGLIQEYKTDNSEIRKINRKRKGVINQAGDLELWDNYILKQSWVDHGYHLLQLEKEQIVATILSPVQAEVHAFNAIGFDLLDAHPLKQKLLNASMECQRVREAARDEVFVQKAINPNFAAALHPLFQKLADVEVQIAQAEKLIPREYAKGKKTVDPLRQRLAKFVLANKMYWGRSSDSQSRAVNLVHFQTYRDTIFGQPAKASNEELSLLAGLLEHEQVKKLANLLDDELTFKIGTLVGGTVPLGLLAVLTLSQIDSFKLSTAEYEERVRAVNTTITQRTATAQATATPTKFIEQARILAAQATQILVVAPPSPSASSTAPPVPTQTRTPSETPTKTPTKTATRTATETQTQAPTVTKTASKAPTKVPTNTPEPTPIPPTATEVKKVAAEVAQAQIDRASQEIAIITKRRLPNGQGLDARGPSVTPGQIRAELKRYGSQYVDLAGYIYDVGVQYDVDPALIMAIWRMESAYHTNGGFENNPGTIIYNSPDFLPGMRKGVSGKSYFPTMKQGVEAIANLLNRFYYPRKQDTTGTIHFGLYENDPNAYHCWCHIGAFSTPDRAAFFGFHEGWVKTMEVIAGLKE